jgi:XTP/dITP diphosphohydrolase
VIPRLVVASKNLDKVTEIRQILTEAGIPSEVAMDLDWPEVEETGSTLEENALLKARAVAAATGLPSLADDTGLEVDALGGAPGVETARYAGPGASYAANVERLLADLKKADRREARFRTVVALAGPAGWVVTAEGVLEGRIARVPRGSGGFGYDPIFEVDHRTLAELPAEEKNRLSHRARALRALAPKLKENQEAADEDQSRAVHQQLGG